jgi:uncharacterized protein (DUF983 family)
MKTQMPLFIDPTFYMNYLASLFKHKCPRCRKGDMFCTKSAYKKGFMKMPEKCSECGQKMEIELGFYYGSAYVSYALTVALSVATFIAWWVIIGLSVDDSRVFGWLIFNALLLVILQPWLMRLSRSIWLSFFVKFNRQPETEQLHKIEVSA